MRKLLSLYIIITLILINLVSGATLPAQAQNDNVLLYQTCINSSYANITSVIMDYNIYIEQASMTEIMDDYYTYNFTNTSSLGTYIVTTRCDQNGIDIVASYDFEVTPNGEVASTGKGIMQIALLLFLVVGLIFSVMGIFKIDHYLGKFTMYWISHLLVIAVSFISWQMANDFLTSVSMIAGMFKIIFYFFMFSAFPMVLLSIVWMFYIHTVTDEMTKMMEKGMSPEEAYKRSWRKRRL